MRPSLREGKLLLAVGECRQRRRGADRGTDLREHESKSVPARAGAVNLVSPTLDVPMKNARWELYLPPDYHYDQFTGTMTREAGVTLATIAADLPAQIEVQFLGLGLFQTELGCEGRGGQGIEVRDLQRQRKNWPRATRQSRGRQFFRAPRNRSGNNDGDRETKEVELQLRQAQASNLVQAQQDFSFPKQRDVRSAGRERAGVDRRGKGWSE